MGPVAVSWQGITAVALVVVVVLALNALPLRALNRRLAAMVSRKESRASRYRSRV